VETVLTLDASSPSSGVFDESVEFSAVLETIDGQPLEGQSVVFRLGPALSARGVTDAAGRATVSLNLLSLPRDTKLFVFFEGTAVYQTSSLVVDFALEKQPPVISGLEELPDVYAGQDSGIVVTLEDQQSEPLGGQGVFIVLTDPNAQDPDAPVVTVAGITNRSGQVFLGTVDLPAGEYTMTVYYNDLSNPLTQRLSSDAYGAARAVATLTVLNGPPDAVDDSVTTDEDIAVTIDVLVNDSDVDGNLDPASAVVVSDPSHGGVVNNGDGTFTYTPAENYNGLDTFDYQVCDTGQDGDGNTDFDDLCDSATVNIAVNGVNDAPIVAAPIPDVTVFQNAPDTVLDLSETFVDVDAATNGDSLTLSVTNDNPALLTASIAGSILTLDYVADQLGTANITVRATDSGGAFVEDTFLVTVNIPNNAPVCLDASADPLTVWPQDKEFHPIHILGVTDPDGDPFTIVIDSIFQDEPVGKNKFSPDGIIDAETAWVRAQRAGKGDGRVYHISFTASDGLGGLCTGEVLVGIVPHDQGGSIIAIDGGPLYDSTIPD
jgi:hypothetical protein